MFFRLVLEGRVQHSAFSSDSLPALTWRLSLGPGPSLYSDQLTFHLYSIHLMRLQKPSLQRLSRQGTLTWAEQPALDRWKTEGCLGRSVPG